jgi:hypothetical protein
MAGHRSRASRTHRTEEAGVGRAQESARRNRSIIVIGASAGGVEALKRIVIPCLFLSGYDSTTIIPEEFAQAPRLSKPVDPKALTTAVALFRHR